jgi:membrane protein
MPEDPSPVAQHRRREHPRAELESARSKFENSWLDELIRQVRALDVFAWTSEFGAEMLWSALPLLILLSSLANERVDDDISRHIGLDRQGAQVLRELFRRSPSHAVVPIVTGLLVSFAGTVMVVQSLQKLYERVFEQQPRGWHGFPRSIIWLLVLSAALFAEGAISNPVRSAAGPIAHGLVTFVAVTIFFAWTMHLLLAGRVPWQRVARPALVTGLLWICLTVFSSLYFSSAVVSDSKDYGPIGVIFSLLTWFILVGVVIVLGALLGAFWQARTRPRATDSS